MEESVKQSTKGPKVPMTPQQRKAKQAEFRKMALKGIREMGPETLANRLA
ncbi:MAG: hypothetical protein HOF74_02420 [Gammaproteobacteria bacterium]|jgi:hypothetical protein|nr:hypothetical protein [Gammaproteobacteria bacterium]MBT3858664.1 hypothetical protein [Gammaproteobacteria bacterium]MBT3987799.1 hypothetical protein [Gammaproteobacteria bacterium]MBT4583281.1 hypothetical protein [Gammaproteobacteria bacterium]MBT4657455.1 hypothetical protein [Gammaproteobacteria bacterium]